MLLAARRSPVVGGGDSAEQLATVWSPKRTILFSTTSRHQAHQRAQPPPVPPASIIVAALAGPTRFRGLSPPLLSPPSDPFVVSCPACFCLRQGGQLPVVRHFQLPPDQVAEGEGGRHQGQAHPQRPHRCGPPADRRSFNDQPMVAGVSLLAPAGSRGPQSAASHAWKDVTSRLGLQTIPAFCVPPFFTSPSSPDLRL